MCVWPLQQPQLALDPAGIQGYACGRGVVPLETVSVSCTPVVCMGASTAGIVFKH